VAEQDHRYVLKLYVTGDTPRSRRAIQNLKDICETELDREYRLEVIDVLKQPQLAEDERILATPLLIKDLPPPLRRLIGDLSDREQVLLGLDVRNRDGSGDRHLAGDPREGTAVTPQEASPQEANPQDMNPKT